MSLSVYGQNPEASLSLEIVPIPVGPALEIETPTGMTATCYRLYAIIPDNYELQIMFGDQGGALQMASAGGFYQNAFGGPTAKSIDPDAVALAPELGFDTWLTIGDDDADGNMSEIYPNDGVFATWETGADLMINDLFGGGLFITTFGSNPQSTGDEDGKVLLAQLTSYGAVWGSLNFQLRRLNPDGTIYDPPGSDTFETELFANMSFSSLIVPAGCPTDVNGDLKTDTGDLLTIIGEFGCATFACVGDVNNSGNVDSSDILVCLGAFGTDCE